jgi:LysM repeat protein
MYPGDTKNGVDKILAANPGLDPKKLKIGQVLVIP